MTIDVVVRHDRQIIVPLRFARAVNGAPQLDAPEVDDRGFSMGARPGNWGNSNTRGAMVGITEGDTVRVRVLREDIDATAPLFITSTDSSIVEIVDPVGGVPLPADGVFRIRGIRDIRNSPVSIEVHLGSDAGPVLAQLEPHVYQLRSLRTRFHLVSINDQVAGKTARTRAGIARIITDVNTIWRPCGIEIDASNVQIVDTHVNGFATNGTVTTNLNAALPTWTEFSRLINSNFNRHRMNIYCIQASTDPNSGWNGLTFDNDSPRGRNDAAGNPNGGFGMVIVDGRPASTFAHELGHYLDLDGHPDIVGGASRDDIFVRRRLMYSGGSLRDVTTFSAPKATIR